MNASTGFAAYALTMLALGPGICVQLAHAQAAADSHGEPAIAVPRSASGFGILQGRWVRPDGGYTLTCDPGNDVLRGVYYQAVARQSFDVHFVRAK